MFWFDRQPAPIFKRSRELRTMAENMAKNPGASTHSAAGMSMKIILQALEERGVPYRIDARPGKGYVIVSLPGS